MARQLRHRQTKEAGTVATRLWSPRHISTPSAPNPSAPQGQIIFPSLRRSPQFHRDKMYRKDVLEYAYRCCKANRGAPGRLWSPRHISTQSASRRLAGRYLQSSHCGRHPCGVWVFSTVLKHRHVVVNGLSAELERCGKIGSVGQSRRLIAGLRWHPCPPRSNCIHCPCWFNE